MSSEAGVLPTDGTHPGTADSPNSVRSARVRIALDEEAEVARDPASSSHTLKETPAHPPSRSVLHQLNNVLEGQFMNFRKDRSDDEDLDTEEESSDCVDVANGVRASGRVSERVKRELKQRHTTFWSRLVEQRWFMSFFMCLTFYALFVPDLEKWLGNKVSYVVVSIVTNAVVVLFILEISVQCLGKPKYICRPYFWLDVVAMASLVPDTWMYIFLIGSGPTLSGQSSRIVQLLRIASRSSRMTRLNRLVRIVRVASLIPKVGSLVGHAVKEEDTEKLLNKKLHRIFTFLDEDMDGHIPRSTAMHCLYKMKDDKIQKTQSFKTISIRGYERFATVVTPFKKSIMIGEGDQHDLSKGEMTPSICPPVTDDAFSAMKNASSSFPSRDMEVHEEGDDGAELSDNPTSMRNSKKNTASSSIPVTSSTAKTLSIRKRTSSHKTTSASSSRSVFRRVTVASKTMTSISDEDGIQEEDLVKYQDFKEIMLEDEDTAAELRRGCRDQLRRGYNTSNLTTRQTEQIGVKVALGVLLLLFLLSLIEPSVSDLSAERGLNHISELAERRYTDAAEGEAIPQFINDHVQVWIDGAGREPESRELVYMDLNHLVYCDDLENGGQPCSPPGSFNPDFVWGLRVDLLGIEDKVTNSDLRGTDLLYVREPDLSESTLSETERNNQTVSVAVVNIRSENENIAQLTILTTISVIVIILAGIFLLTKDLTFLSRNLLKPLRELADDMESIAQLHVAALGDDQQPPDPSGTSEIQLIRRTFENMKKAIKSWGKYVPWPVVQLMLRANKEADLDVNEEEVTIFFSDIASFTTIVERIPPESSLLLLSKYFNDMSKVIDDHSGVVLEFIGDAILCIYGKPIEDPEHPTTAVRSTLKMLSQLRRINDWSEKKDPPLPRVEIRCGVHTGKVLVGNMGFDSRMKYGIVGEDAHIPSRLEEINKNYKTNFLISQNTLDRLDKDTFITRPIDYVYLRHTPDSSAELIHEVRAMSKKHAKTHREWPAAALHAEAMELYKARDFKQAAAKFEDVAAMMHEITGGEEDHEDYPSLLMLSRCESYIGRPPPAKWQGVWDRGDEKH